MAESVTKLQVFISGPGDTLREQQLTARTIRSMNQSQMKYLGITLQSLSWKEDLKADFGIYAQDVVNKQFGDKWDIYIGVLWARHGTPTPKAQSGTEEEFDLAYKRWKADNKSCKVAVFFSDAPIPPSTDAEQLQKVQTFRRKIEASGGIYTTFTDTEDFIFKVRDYLSDTTSSYGKDWGTASPKPVREPSYSNGKPTIGFLSFSKMDVTRIALLFASTFIVFMITFTTDMTTIKNLGKELREQLDAHPKPRTKIEGRTWTTIMRGKTSRAFLGASVKIEGNLPKIREAWGNLSSMLFKLLSHPELDNALTFESAQDISSKIALMTPQVNEARRSLSELKETYKTLPLVSVESRKRLVNALEALDNEYAFIADECDDIDTFFQRKTKTLFH